MWLRICEKEGLNGREPVTTYTYENYEYRAGFIKAYEWPKTAGRAHRARHRRFPVLAAERRVAVQSPARYFRHFTRS